MMPKMPQRLNVRRRKKDFGCRKKELNVKTSFSILPISFCMSYVEIKNEFHWFDTILVLT